MKNSSAVLYSAFCNGSFFFVLIFALFLFNGCASPQKDEIGPELRSLLGIDEKLSETPQEDLEKTFDANTLIKRAETYYAKEEYESALVEYQRFLDLHPIDRLAHLAKFRIGLCYYHQIKTIDRDLEPIQKALAVFQNLVAEAPQSLYAQKAEPYINELKIKLANREFYIGYFYYKKGAYPAALARMNQILKEYPESNKTNDALFYLGSSYQKTGELEKAKEIFSQLLKKDPQTRYREQIDQLFPSL
ncbi:MAG: outer membrane protein assembly factor BamD [Nitrospirae bacterium]|nr:outer membrane protein assembly factor BamD [Nitrospirota bacterium]MBI3351871.1 outer membrane protein assembly factor BamD [Nitrospirota bacterium]